MRRVVNMGLNHVQRLRLASPAWRLVCNAEAVSFKCVSDRLSAAVLCASSLPRLRKLNIQRSKDRSCTLKPEMLTCLEGKKLEKLTLKGCQSLRAVHYKMVVEDCSKLLLPWSQSLQCLQLVRCKLLQGVVGDAFAGPAFFSKFPHLKFLKLEGVRAEPPLTSLDLQGCKNLCSLDCYHGQLSSLILKGCKQLKNLSLVENRVSTLDLSDCGELVRLRCNSNHLAALDLSACTKLTHVACSSNRFVNLDLTSCSRLKELLCSHNNQLQSLWLHDTAKLKDVKIDCSAEAMIVTGNASIYSLCCDAGSINLIPPKMRAQLKFLILEGEVISEVAGFENLCFLICSIGPTGLMDLTGCEGVKLTINEAPNGFLLNGRSAVTNLTLWGQVYMLGFQGFTSLEELDISASNYDDISLDLSMCPSIIKLQISEEGEVGSCEVFRINLHGCSSLKVLDLGFLSYLDVLDLSSCVALTKLTCVGSDLQQLDVSCCPFLTSLDIGCSKLLQTVTVHGSLPHNKIIQDRCPQLSITCI